MASAEFWYEFASTYSYPAALRVAALADERGVRLVWRPFLLGPIFCRARLAQLAVQHLSGQGPLHVARPRANVRRDGRSAQAS